MRNPPRPAWLDQAPQPINGQAEPAEVKTSRLECTNDRSELGQHLQQCAHARGRLHLLRCAAEAVNTFLMPRFVTTLGVMAILMLSGMTLMG